MAFENKIFKNKGIKKGLFYIFSASSAQYFLQFFSLMILSRLLSPEEFGVCAIALFIVNFFSLLSTSFIAQALVSIDVLTSRLLRTAMSVTVFLALLFSFLTYILSEAFSEYYDFDELDAIVKYLSFFCFLKVLSSFPQGILQRDLKFSIIAKINILSYFFGFFVFSIFFAYAGHGVWSLVYASSIQFLIFFSLSYFSYRGPCGISFNKEDIIVIGRFSFFHSAAEIINYLANQIDNLMIGKVLGASNLGAYSRAYQLMMLPVSLIGVTLDKIYFPTLSRLRSKKSYTFSCLILVLQTLFILSLPISMILYFLSEQIVSVVLGPNWLIVNDLLRIFALVIFFRVAYKFFDTILKSHNKLKERLSAQIFYLFSCFILSLGGAIYNGIEGVAYGVSIAILANFLILGFFVLRVINRQSHIFFVFGLKLVLLASPLIYFTHLFFDLFLNKFNLNIFLFFCVGSVFIFLIAFTWFVFVFLTFKHSFHPGIRKFINKRLVFR